MELTLNEALKKGIEAHKAGQVQEADRLYTAILKVQPKHPAANHNMGLLTASLGKIQEALPFFKTALEANSRRGQFWLSYIGALMKLGRSTDAQTAFDQAKEKGANGEVFDQLEKRLSELSANPQDPPADQLQPIINLYSQGHLKQALSESGQMLERFPNAIVLYNIAGLANSGLRQFDAAINVYKQALKIKPDYAEAYNNMGIALKGNGALEAAIGSYKRALKIKPDYADAYYNMGNALQDKGNLQASIESYKQALKIKPHFAEAHNNMGSALKDKGDIEAAIDSYKQALNIKPDYAEAYNNVGNILTDKDDIEAAIDSYKQALKVKPDYAEAYYNMGNALKENGDLEAAINSYKQALKIKPDYAEVYNNMGGALKDKGDPEAAIDSYNHAIKIQPDNAETYRLLSRLNYGKEHDKHVVRMQRLCLDPSITDEQRCHLSFALSKASEDLNEIGQSFTYLKTGNELRKKILSYDINRDIELFSQLKKSYPDIAKVALLSAGETSELKPIFILGMPRSGTTLVEQIVSSHSEVAGAGELHYVDKFGQSIALGEIKSNTEAILDFRQSYIEALQKKSDSMPHVTDKMPQNFLYVGLIFSAFPDAKVIHVNRDPAATCWSNYKHYFTNKGLGHSYDLDDVVTYFGLYKDLMQFWQGHYGGRIFDLNYDNLTINQEDETRKLIQYLGLEWEDKCLSPQSNKRSVRTASQQQVRQKVYQGSSQQWRKFESYLNGVFDQLGSSAQQPLT